MFNQGCQFWTYDAADGLCTAFSDCGQFDDTICPDNNCLSGSKNCKVNVETPRHRPSSHQFIAICAFS